jgi:hypothetical protein
MYEKCILLLSLCLAMATSVTADIRNGYAPDLPAARECLRALNRRLMENADMPDPERRRINAARKKHLEFIANYELTEALLRQMQMISPEMYYEMNQLKDRRGRVTDIYVRFIPEERASVLLSGVSYFHSSQKDEDASHSRFGEFSVSIDVWICETALHLLAHEFGHAKYIVPNLADYRRYYAGIYKQSKIGSSLGHHASDDSGKMAFAFAHQFQRDRRAFRVIAGQPPRRVFIIARDTRRSVQEAVDVIVDESIASSDTFK